MMNGNDLASPAIATAEQAVAMCEFVRSLALSLNSIYYRNREAVQQLQLSTGWSEEACKRVIQDCESSLANRIHECIIPSWFRVSEHFKPKVALLRERSLQKFLPWALEVLEKIHRAFASRPEDLRPRLYAIFIEKNQLAEAKRLCPNLVARFERFEPVVGDDRKVTGKADFTLIADLYHGAAQLLANDISYLTTAALEKSEPRRCAASSLTALAAPSMRSYACTVSEPWPESIETSDGSVLLRGDIEAFMRTVRKWMPEYILEPPWLEGRRVWADVRLCKGDEDAVTFSSVMLKKLEELLETCPRTLNEPLTMTLLASDWNLVKSFADSGLSATTVQSSLSSGPFSDPRPKIKLTGTEGIRNTYREIREKLTQYLKTSSFGRLKQLNFPKSVVALPDMD